MKQVPYTVVQLTTFQLTTDVAYNRFLPHVTGKTKDELPLAYGHTHTQRGSHSHKDNTEATYRHTQRGLHWAPRVTHSYACVRAC
jgi:hypothetical protein